MASSHGRRVQRVPPGESSPNPALSAPARRQARRQQRRSQRVSPKAASPFQGSLASPPASRSPGLRPKPPRSSPPQVIPRNLASRFWVVWGILLTGLMALGYRLHHLQLIQGATLAERASSQQSTAITPLMPRRTIVDRLGDVLAVDKTLYTLYAHPALFSLDMIDVAAQLAPLIAQDPQTLLTTFQSQDTGISVAQDLTKEQADRIQDLLLNGLELIPHQRRIYPTGDLFSQVVGYVNLEYQEQTGLELAFSDRLRRSLPDLTVRRMGNGLMFADQLPEALVYQDDLRLQLTLDNRLQRAAASTLGAQLQKFKAKRGAVMVMDVRDGSLLALVTLPTYDPNHYYNENVELFRNWAVSDLYEPGSTFKPINVAIALEAGAITPNDTIYDEGQIQRGGWPIQNHDFSTAGGGGVLSMSQVLQRSSNVGMVHIMERVEPQNYYEALQKLGIGDPVDTDLPLATPGQLRDRALFLESVVDRATNAFGQGISLTPLQMLQLHGILANGGRWIRPHVLRGLVDAQGEVAWAPDPPEERVIFTPETSRAVLGMMEDVVTLGTAGGAKVSGYRIGGKTGTAQKADNGTYIPGARITSFVGILPVNDPRYVVFAVIDEPEGENAYGSTVAVPIVHQMLSALITLYSLPPDQSANPVISPNPVPAEGAVPGAEPATPDPEGVPGAEPSTPDQGASPEPPADLGTP